MPEYRVVSGKVRIPSGEGPDEDYVATAGDTVELTEAQAEVFEVEPVDEGDESEPEPEPEPDEGDGDEDTAEGVPDDLTAEWVEGADYPELRSAAGEFEDVNGNWGEDRLRSELLDRVEG